MKDEAQNPTQSFKARGMAVAVSMAKHLGATKLAVPTAGNAGGALAAYAARAGLEAHIFMPRDTPRANIIECRELGANVVLIDGLITDCGAEIARRKAAEGWFDMSTLKEPYRVEGKKTLGYELAEQLGWALPDVILYPTGGGTGLIGMWKAFDEMETLGWIGLGATADVLRASERLRADRPRLRSGRDEPRPSFRMRTPARPVCAFRRRSAIFSCSRFCANPTAAAVTVEDEEMIRDHARSGSGRRTLRCAGRRRLFCGASQIAGRGENQRPTSAIVIFNTGSGIKYLDCYEE